MMMLKHVLTAVSLLVAGTGLFASSASADVLVWSFRSDYPYKVQLEFYSRDYNRAWPGGTQAYGLDDYNVHTFRLSCISGEWICYGAWVTGDSSSYWGVGFDDEHYCSNCCYQCGARNLPVRVLE